MGTVTYCSVCGNESDKSQHEIRLAFPSEAHLFREALPIKWGADAIISVWMRSALSGDCDVDICRECLLKALREALDREEKHTKKVPYDLIGARFTSTYPSLRSWEIMELVAGQFRVTDIPDSRGYFLVTADMFVKPIS